MVAFCRRVPCAAGKPAVSGVRHVRDMRRRYLVACRTEVWLAAYGLCAMKLRTPTLNRCRALDLSVESLDEM